MSDYIDVGITAIPVVQTHDIDEDDECVPGVYSVMVPKGLSPETMASIALDTFHSECGVSVLEAFEFYVFDPRTGLVLAEAGEHESYSMSHMGRDLERLTQIPHPIFGVSIEAVGDDGKTTRLGSVSIAAVNKKSAREIGQKTAMDALWDSRLDSASCKPRFNIEQTA